MYLKEFSKPPAKIVNNGKAAFGTYNDIPPKLDVKGMRAPYAGLPLPVFLSKLRIKSRLDYIFSTDKVIGLVEFHDFKIFGLAEIIFWNMSTGRKYVYHTFTATRKRIIPKNTSQGICASYKKSRYIKVSWGRNHRHMAMKFNVKGDNIRPSARGYIFSPMNSRMHTDLLFVCPSPSQSRCSATWFTTMKMQGNFFVDDEKLDSSEGLAAMRINRTYFKMHTRFTLAWGIGKIQSKNVIFQLKNSSLDAADPDKYNENLITVDGDTTALPSVLMTHPFGIKKDWIIQDTESMIDLTFTPVSDNHRILNVIAIRTDYNVIYGYYNGVMLTKNGEKLVLKNFPGIINKSTLRI